MLTLDSERPSQSGRNMLESVDDLFRNRWTVCAGISGRISSESVDGMVRITHSGWVQTYKRMVGTLDLDEISFAEAYAMLRQFLDPVLGSRIEVARWNPSKWDWE